MATSCGELKRTFGTGTGRAAAGGLLHKAEASGGGERLRG